MKNAMYSLKQNLAGRYDAGVVILLFMVTIYPFIVIPGHLPYFYGPRYYVLMAVSLITAVLLYKKDIKLDRAALFPLIAFIIMLFLATLFSDNILQAWRGSLNRYTGSSTYVFCAALFIMSSQIKSRERIINAMVIAAAVVSVTAIMQHYSINIVPHEPFRIRLHSFGTMGHPNFLATYTVFILPASIMLYLHRYRPQWLICSALIFAALLTSLTRGAWLAFGAILLLFFYYVFKNPQFRKRMIIVLLVFLAVYLVLIYDSSDLFTDRASTIPAELGSVPQYTESVTKETDSSVAVRVYVWQETLKIIADNWAFGVGPDNLRIPVPHGYVEDKAFNFFLEIAVTMGIFALIAYLALIYNSLKQNKGWFGIMLSLMIAAYLLQGQFNMEVIMNLPLFWIVLGLTWAD